MANKSHAKYQRVIHLLSKKPPVSCRTETIDFVKLGLPIYQNHFAMLIHDALSAPECEALLAAAEEAETWEPALINAGGGRQELATDVRSCDRILWDCPELAGKILERTLPHLPEDIKTLKNNATITGNAAVLKKQTLKLSRLNERLRFLKYTKGCYFRPHGDGSYTTPSGEETTYLTLHLYLNGGEESAEQYREVQDDAKKPLVGGATRFFAYNMEDGWDLNPRTGSIVVFQHRNLLHSGEDVLQGTKYTMRTDVFYRAVPAES